MSPLAWFLLFVCGPLAVGFVVDLICEPRPAPAPDGTAGDLLADLPAEVLSPAEITRRLEGIYL